MSAREQFAHLSEIDIEVIEEAADALVRLNQLQTAVKLYALALRLRATRREWDEIGSLLRSQDAVT